MDATETGKLEVTKRTKLRRFPVRGRFDKGTIYKILDATPLAHIGFQGETPSVLPTVFWRDGDHVYFHGSAKNRMLGAMSTATSCCLAVTILDGFVAARAALHHSVNYRSVIIYGDAEEVADDDRKLTALKGLIERFYPGRWENIRLPSPDEFAAVRVFKVPIVEASAKVRSGFPTPYPEDFGIPVWAGIIPVKMELGPPQLDPNSDPNTQMHDPSHLRNMLDDAGSAKAERDLLNRPLS